MKKAYLPLLATAVMLAGCGDNPVQVQDATFMQANISGEFSQTFQGTGQFHLGTPPGRPAGDFFQIVSRGNGDLSTAGFAITSWAGGQLSAGAHALSLPNFDVFRAGGAPPQGVTLQYFRRVPSQQFQSGAAIEYWVASAGQLSLTMSTADRVEGTFSGPAIRYCIRDASLQSQQQIGTCEIPSQPTGINPQIMVTGTFRADRMAPPEISPLR